MHRQAHGLIPNIIIEVHPSTVASFLGRVADPDGAAANAVHLQTQAKSWQRVSCELCSGKSFTFRRYGEVDLIGFPDPVELHEVDWIG